MCSTCFALRSSPAIHHAALEHYRDQIALRCRCPHLETVWDDPDRRWLFKNKPENQLQECLHQYLVFSLRDHKRIEVRREQPAGGRKPPDIKVTWSLTNRLAYIEVKWMGASVHKDEPRISWTPGEDEANKGAEQLVGYLVENEPEAPGHQRWASSLCSTAVERGWPMTRPP